MEDKKARDVSAFPRRLKPRSLDKRAAGLKSRPFKAKATSRRRLLRLPTRFA